MPLISRGSSLRLSFWPNQRTSLLPLPPLLDAPLDFPLRVIGHLAPARAATGLDILREAFLTAATMFWYPVQRHTLPLRASRMSESEGVGWRASRSWEDMIMPGVQKPHCRPCSSQKPF